MSKQWLVLDVRLAKDGINSGISRFIVGLTCALAEELSSRKKNNPGTLVPKLLLVSKFEPAHWMVSLVKDYPDCVSFWSGGKGSLSKIWDKPVYYWSTSTFLKIKTFFGEDFLWLAPGNYDRPLAISLGKKNTRKVVQIVHDIIPFAQRKSVGMMFGMQYRCRVKRALTKLPLICTVSEHSSQMLKHLTPNPVNIAVLGEGIDNIFGEKPKPQGAQELNFLKKQWLANIGFIAPANKGELENQLVANKWIIGVGRNQQYKGWDVAERSITACRNKIADGVAFLRVVGDRAGADYYCARGAVACGQVFYLAEQNLLIIPNISDEQLAWLYRVSDLLIHPSLAEGFGLPPVEAALSGLPVIFRKGTAIDSHFREGALPDFFWHPVEGKNEGEWALGILQILEKNARMKDFYAAMAAASTPREFILNLTDKDAFQWKHAARNMLEAVNGL